MQLPLSQVAFSMPNSFLTLRRMEASRVFAHELGDLPEGIYLRTVDTRGRHLCFRFEPQYKGAPCAYEARADEGEFLFTTAHGQISVTFEDTQTLLIEGHGVGLRLDMPIVAYEYVAPYGENRCLVNTSLCFCQFMLSCLSGEMHVDAPYGKQSAQYIHCDFAPGRDGRFRVIVDQFETVWHERDYEGDARLNAKRLRESFEAFCAPFPKPPKRYEETMRLCQYVMWSAYIPAGGLLKRDGMLMSNNWMLNVWTWDSALNAIGLSLGHPDKALDQLLIPFDHQRPEGLLPDFVNRHDILWNFTKPPVHGLTATYLIPHLSKEALGDLYCKLIKQVEYWLTYADTDRDGIPQYNHGNDCGWDNCTSFQVGAPVEGPDLSSYLVLQMRTLSDMARRLDREEEVRAWAEKSEKLLHTLIAHSWDGDQFIVYQSGTHRYNPNGDSLYPFLPLVLGKLLPPEIFKKLVDGLKRENRFLTPYGLATESTSSADYTPNGYWRGPIWAPPMLLLVRGIADGGDAEFARLLADRFCDLVKKSGLAENFDALTGESLCDPAYTWTAAAFMLLSCRYATQDADQ